METSKDFPGDKLMVQSKNNLCIKIGYPSVKYFRLIFQSQQIIGCPVMIQDIYIARALWINKIAALKWKTTRKELIHMS